MGPRSFDRRKPVAVVLSRTHAGKLQWGRDLSIAETEEEMVALKTENTLQWGRDLSIAETVRRAGWAA